VEAAKQGIYQWRSGWKMSHLDSGFSEHYQYVGLDVIGVLMYQNRDNARIHSKSTTMLRRREALQPQD
jgi:hypothetical protein